MCKGILVRTHSSGVTERRIHLILLASLSFALLWQAVDCAADAQRYQQPCEWATSHFEKNIFSRESRKLIELIKE